MRSAGLSQLRIRRGRSFEELLQEGDLFRVVHREVGALGESSRAEARSSGSPSPTSMRSGPENFVLGLKRTDAEMFTTDT